MQYREVLLPVSFLSCVDLVQAVVGMFAYMTDLATVQEANSIVLEAEGYVCSAVGVLTSIFSTLGHDLESLLYKLLDEFLYNFSADPFFIPKVSSYSCLCVSCYCNAT